MIFDVLLRSRYLAIVLLALSAGSGCYALAFPAPVRMSLGTGGRLGGTIAHQDDMGTQSTAPDNQVNRATIVVQPLQGWQERPFDIGISAEVMSFGDDDGSSNTDSFNHAKFGLEGIYYPVRYIQAPNQSLRVGVIGGVQAVYDNGLKSRDGFTLSTGISIESVLHYRSTDSGSKVRSGKSSGPMASAWYGEAAIGGQLVASVNRVHGQTFGTLTVGVVFRLPMGAMVGVITGLDIDDDD